MKIYLAGPLFTSGEREFNAALAQALRLRGHQVYLPQDSASADDDADFIFDACLRGIEWCEVVVANMDGPDPDSGTAFECGKAYGLRPLILFRTDFRSASDHPDVPFNLMLARAADVVFRMPLAGPHQVADKVTTWAAEMGLR